MAKFIRENIIKIVIIILCLLAGLVFARIYRTNTNNINIYKHALTDYENANYSNAYYLFSKISISSKLKPVAIYRQALCAKALGDEKSQIDRYQALFRYFPKNRLSAEAKYEAAQLILDTDPLLARIYFESVLKSKINENYKIASKYYISRIDSLKVRYAGHNPSEEKVKEIDYGFRYYLQKTPDGRLATNVANSWLKFNNDLNSADKTLIARSYYFAKQYDKAKEIFEKTELKDSWTIQAMNYFRMNDLAKGADLTEKGVSQFSDSVDTKDLKTTVNEYLKNSKDKYKAASKLFNMSKGKAKEHLWALKCENSPKNEKPACYTDFYKNYSTGEYAQDALAKIFFYQIQYKNYSKALNTGKDFINKFPNSQDIPHVMYWEGKIAQMYNKPDLAIKYFQDIVNIYPDSYYAYRAFWLLKGIGPDIIQTKLEFRPVEYPYEYPLQDSLEYNLIEAGDYNLLIKLSHDDFIKSWAEFQKGNYATSMHIAQKAISKLTTKPPKTDLRWRLAYPMNYFRQVQSVSNIYNNNSALIMGIIKEESYFNSEAQSSAGAIGLMQLMPQTAHDIGSKYGIKFNTNYLFNPELNIKIGNLYYASLRKMLNNNDIYSVASYNGGIGSVIRWEKELKYSDTDEFIEQIPYEETKNYIKKVFRSYWNYIRIYQQQ